MPEDIAASADLSSLFARQRDAYASQPYPSLSERRDALHRLRDGLKRHAPAIAAAVARDFSARAYDETITVDILPSMQHVDHILARLKRWMKPSKRHPERLFFGNRAYVMYQPKGVVGIVVPWNFPVYLALGPLATALAAGNRCLIKTSEFAPSTSQALRAMLSDCFSDAEVAIVEGDADVARQFTSLPFDHIVFTGSPEVGRHVMRAAAGNLTPVTLELGGKSPAIVSRSADFKAAAKRVAHGKTVNAGQICVAPDYVMVPQGLADSFALDVVSTSERFFPRGSNDYTAIINERAYHRLHDLLDDARAHGAKVIACSMPDDGRRLPLHIVLGVTAEMRIAKEEIFGPILPVWTYRKFDEVIAHINAGTRPLALYYFGDDRGESDNLLHRTHAGGVTINDWGWHVINHDLPFGGVGTSGMGNYHGEEGFRELSHGKSVFIERKWFPVHLFHPPYGGKIPRLVQRHFFGRTFETSENAAQHN